jgi:hypothetical protein
MVNTTGTGSPDLKQEAGDAGHRVADTARQEARSVGSEVRDQSRHLADRVGEEVRSQASTQQHRAAGGLRDVGEQFSRMADSSEQDGVAQQIVGTVGERAEHVAAWLDHREPDDVLEEVKRFARRRPGVFLAIAAGAGVVIGRLTRSLASDAADSTGGSTTGGSTAVRPRSETTSTDRLDTAGTVPSRAGGVGTSGTATGPSTVGASGPAGTGAHIAGAGRTAEPTTVTDTRPARGGGVASEWSDEGRTSGAP